jgi:hypothetical protein
VPQHDRRYWVFCANPRSYKVIEAIRNEQIHTWIVTRGDVRKGDRAIIWKSKGNDHDRGIVAFAEVLTDPKPGMEPQYAYWKASDVPDKATPRVSIRLFKPEGLPIWESGPARDILTSLSVSRATGGTVFKVTAEQWDSLMDYIGGWPGERES